MIVYQTCLGYPVTFDDILHVRPQERAWLLTLPDRVVKLEQLLAKRNDEIAQIRSLYYASGTSVVFEEGTYITKCASVQDLVGEHTRLEASKNAAIEEKNFEHAEGILTRIGQVKAQIVTAREQVRFERFKRLLSIRVQYSTKSNRGHAKGVLM